MALNQKQVKSNPLRISNIKSFIDQYNLKDMNIPSHKKEWKKFELNNKSIALDVFYIRYNNVKIRHA